MSTATLERPVVIAPPGLPRREWLAVRRSGIGGSDVAGILGMSRFTSPLGVYLDKLGEIDDDGASEAAEWGNRLEPVIAAKFAECHSELDVRPSPGVLAHPDRRWQIVNVDRLLSPRPSAVGNGEVDGVLEVKTANQWLNAEWDGEAGQVPAAALLQVHHEMAVTGASYAWLAALVGGQRFVQCRVERDEEMVERLAEIEGAFWQRVLDRNPPPIDGSKATSDLLGRLYEVDPDSVVVLDPTEFLPLRHAYTEAKAAKKAAEERSTAAENALKALLGPKEVGVLDGEPVVTWKSIERAGYEVAPTTYRRLYVPKARIR